MRVTLAPVLVTLAILPSCGTRAPAPPPTPPPGPPPPPSLVAPGETRLAEIRQLTAGGENAEAYWSHDGRQLIYQGRGQARGQSTGEPYACDQIFRIDVDAPGAKPELVSTGTGRTTCSYFVPGDRTILYSSTHLDGSACPPAPDHSQGYVWALYDSYDVFSAKPDGSELRRLTSEKAYDAEATVCPRDGSIVFTSTRDGDIELYRMDPDGKNVVRLTHEPGYDGGAFFSPDCTKLVWRASRPRPGPELDDFRALLQNGLVRPSKLELWVANADGSEARQITYLDAASFAPAWFPSGERLLFSSNVGDPRGREFEIWAVNADGTALERVTSSPGFDGFPMFSPDGTRVAFASNRNQQVEGETNVFVARWVAGEPVSTESAADRLRRDIAWLADDARGGRGTGDPGLDEARTYVEERFRALGLETSVQAIDVPVGIKPLEGVALALDGEPIEPVQWMPLGFSTSGEVEAPVVVAGYGISAPELGIDDYKGVNAKDKIVVVRRFVPEDERFVNPELEQRYGSSRWKAWNAREHGAKALLIVDLPVVKKKGGEMPPDARFPPLAVDPLGDAGLPVAVVARNRGDVLFKKGKHTARLVVKLEIERQKVHNVIAVKRAEAGGKGAIVVGAHYDHLGMGGAGSMAPGVSEAHNGADDNASGTAALLELGRELGGAKGLARDVYLVAFSAEERGIVGSTSFVRSPPAGLAIKDVAAMLNMDMIGRLRGNKLTVSGTGSAAEWDALVGKACESLHLECKLGGDGYGPSDHTPFYGAGVPVLHFFTGAHREYHTPLDDVGLINAAGAARVTELVAALARDLSTRPQLALTYKFVPPPPSQGDVRSYGASMGTIPDYTDPGTSGVLLGGVRAGGPADQAGLKKGDRLLKIGKHELRNVQDFTYVLHRAKPGEKAKVVYEREGKKHEAEVTFGVSTRKP